VVASTGKVHIVPKGGTSGVYALQGKKKYWFSAKGCLGCKEKKKHHASVDGEQNMPPTEAGVGKRVEIHQVDWCKKVWAEQRTNRRSAPAMGGSQTKQLKSAES